MILNQITKCIHYSVIELPNKFVLGVNVVNAKWIN